MSITLDTIPDPEENAAYPYIEGNRTRHQNYEKYVPIDRQLLNGIYFILLNMFIINNAFTFILRIILLCAYVYDFYAIVKNIGHSDWANDLLNRYVELMLRTPPILDAKEYFPNGTILLQKNHREIKKEINKLISDSNCGGYPYFIKQNGKMIEKSKIHTPILYRLFRKIPEAKNVSISILEKKQHTPIHVGYTKMYTKSLFCVDIPDTLNDQSKKSFIYINGEKQIFENNKIISFDDLYPNEMYNMSDNDSILIDADVIRKFRWNILNTIIGKIYDMLQ